jgi:hypothetical protein
VGDWRMLLRGRWRKHSSAVWDGGIRATSMAPLPVSYSSNAVVENVGKW